MKLQFCAEASFSLHLILLGDRSVGWIEAKKGCEGRGARLVSLETEAKMQNLLDWVSDKTRRRRSKYWVGGNDIEVEGAWEWEGTRAKVFYPFH